VCSAEVLSRNRAVGAAAAAAAIPRSSSMGGARAGMPAAWRFRARVSGGCRGAIKPRPAARPHKDVRK
jgi:hypothetical protein